MMSKKKFISMPRDCYWSNKRVFRLMLIANARLKRNGKELTVQFLISEIKNSPISSSRLNSRLKKKTKRVQKNRQKVRKCNRWQLLVLTQVKRLKHIKPGVKSQSIRIVNRRWATLASSTKLFWELWLVW